MRKMIYLLLIFTFQGLTVLAQHQHSPYSGQETREIKALSPEEIQSYLSGSGMGFAKAAELNRFPGPKHVLELADQLNLTTEQKEKSEQLYLQMSQNAMELGRKIIDLEQRLDHLFATEQISDQSLAKTVNEIGSLHAELRAVHLKAHIAQKAILSRQQIDQYVSLRGYHNKHIQEGHSQNH